MLSRTATLPAHSNRLAPVVASQASNPARRIPAADLRASTSSPLASTSRDVKSYAQMNAFPVPTWDSGRFYEEEMACLGDDCPKIVAQVISYEEDVLTASPSETLESIIPRLGNVSFALLTFAHIKFTPRSFNRVDQNNCYLLKPVINKHMNLNRPFY